jgi:hypothetical protein
MAVYVIAFGDPEYRPLRELRQRISTADIVMVEGL